jgi:hypothetical protein
MTEDAAQPVKFWRASSPNPRRALLCYALGALTGLAIAGYGLFTASGTSTHRLPPEDIALVNRRPILRSDFITQLESETGAPYAASTAAERRKVFDEMLREELLVQRALELDFAETDQATRNALVATISDQATLEVTTNPPTDAELMAYYNAHREHYASEGTMHWRALIVPTAAPPSPETLVRAQAAVAALRAQTPVETTMARFGLSEPERFEENYYFAAEYRLGAAVFARIKDLPGGAVSDPLVTAQGLMIVVVLANHLPVPLDFSAARQQVLTDYQAAAHQRLLDATLQYLRERAKLVVDEEFAAVLPASAVRARSSGQ